LGAFDQSPLTQEKKENMIYQLSLQTMGVAAGLALVIFHAAGLINIPASIQVARRFPRSRPAGTILLFIAAAWSFLLVKEIDLGEFSKLRGVMLIGIAAGAVLSWIYVEEFLAVRALGMLLLLCAEPTLESAMLRTEPSRLFLVVLAYGWIIGGLFFVGMPYLLRDAIKILSSSHLIWRSAALAGLVYGAVLLTASLLWW
jgi:hypothetical protein